MAGCANNGQRRARKHCGHRFQGPTKIPVHDVSSLVYLLNKNNPAGGEPRWTILNPA
jgi:hypothetical protein